MEETASEMLVPRVSRDMLRFHLLRLYNDKKRRGFLTKFPALHMLPIVQNLLDINQTFFYELRRKIFRREFDKYDKLAKRVREEGIIKNHLENEIKKLIKHLKDLKKFAKEDLIVNEISDYIIKFAGINEIINDFIFLKNKEYVYWVELSSHKIESNITLCASPFNISE